MFSQLCRVGLPRTLWDKIAVIGQLEEVSRVEEDSEKEATRCQLQNCTFCDYRPSFSKEVPHLQSPASCQEATNNPAYGLSVKNWFEFGPIEEGNEEVSNETMEPLSHDAGSKRDTMRVPPSSKDVPKNDASQQETNAKNSNPTLSPNHTNKPILETRHKIIDPPNERSDSCKSTDQKHCGLSWSVLKQRQIDSVENCDKPCAIEQPICDKAPREPSRMDCSREQTDGFKTKRNSKDRSFPLSLMKPITKMAEKKSSDPSKPDPSRQQRPANPHRRFSSDLLADASDPLSAIEQIKTEESIQEWLARISESSSQLPAEDDDTRTAWGTRRARKESRKETPRTSAAHALHKGLQEALEMSHAKPPLPNPDPTHHQEGESTAALLVHASKASPANIPMVVMQCSRLHSHIGSQPPFQQTSLPMGTLVTALYQESDDWLYVQTPHGVEGFIVASNCAPIGTANDLHPASRRPWEPCDFPVEIKVHQQQSLCVKVKGHFYSERCLGLHTFKSRDSIKTAKTVTDILRNSPETEISSQ